MTYRSVITLAVIALLATVSSIPLFLSGAPMGDDAVIHYRWASEFFAALGDGSLYPQWLSGSNYGHGSPAMIYYPPLPFYVVALFSAISGNMLTGMVLGCWLALFLSGWSIYRLTRALAEGWASLFAVSLYVLGPYLLFDLYYRSALSEVWAFAWVPLVFHASSRILRADGWKTVPLLAISYGATVLTHLPTAMAVSVVLPIYLLVLRPTGAQLFKVGSALSLGVGASAMFALPLLIERAYVHYHKALAYDYSSFFLFRNFSLHLYAILTEHGNESFLLSSNWIGSGALLLFIVASFIIHKRLWLAQEKSNHVLLCQALWAATAFSLFMTTPLSAALWRAIPNMAYMQFPVRWLLIAWLGISVLAAAAASALMQTRQAKQFCACAFAGGVAFNMMISAVTLVKAPFDTAILDGTPNSEDVIEYRPIWWDGEPHAEFETTAVIIEAGEASSVPVDDWGNTQSYLVNAETDAVIRLRPLFFPGWNARTNGSSIPVQAGPQGNIQLNVNAGTHFLELEFTDTWPRAVGKAISGLSALIILVWACQTYFRDKNAVPGQSSSSAEKINGRYRK